MKLTEAAPRMGLKASYLVKLVRDRQRPAKTRQYAANLHECYLTAHFVKDTKGRSNVSRGCFPWHIADDRVERFERRHRLMLTGRDEARRNNSTSIAQQLKEVGL